MKSPKGFGKRYFTLVAILAYSVQNRLNASIVKIEYLLKCQFHKEDSEIDEDDPPTDIIPSFCLSNYKPCYCNYFYRLKTKLALKINKFIPRCPYYTTYYAFRRSGAHPPNISS